MIAECRGARPARKMLNLTPSVNSSILKIPGSDIPICFTYLIALTPRLHRNNFHHAFSKNNYRVIFKRLFTTELRVKFFHKAGKDEIRITIGISPDDINLKDIN